MMEMEQIKRLNKIWTNDSLFLRESLDIPLPGDHTVIDDDTSSSFADPLSLNGSQDDEDDDTISSGSMEPPMEPVSLRENGVPRSNGRPPHRPPAPSSSSTSSLLVSPGSCPPWDCDKSEMSIADLLIQIDSSIAQTKNNIQKMGKIKDFYSDDDLYVGTSRHRNHVTTSSQGNSVNVSPATGTARWHHGSTDLPQVLTTQGRRVRTSLQRLQQQQDEIFEL